MKRKLFVKGKPLTCSLAFAALILVLLAGVIPVSQEAAAQAAASLNDIKVSFKLDPRITRGMYMGDRWISPPTYVGVGEGREMTVEARAEGLDAKGNPMDVSPEWMPANPGMVAVSPAQGKEVKITVRSGGQSSLKVSSLGISKDLLIKATYEGNAIKVEITRGQALNPVSGGNSTGQALAEEKQEAREDTSRQKEKVSYSLGYETGRSMKNQSVDLDPDIFTKAFREGFAGDKAAMTDQEIREAIQSLQKEMKAKRAEEMKKSPESGQSATKNKKEGEAFLAENVKKEGVVTLPSGLLYKIIQEGAGKQPAKTDKVEVHYRGTFVNGTEFDNSYKRGRPATFEVDKVIKGWTEALQLMKEGSKWVVYIPPGLAYGERGTVRGKGANARAMIGPNQTLIFEVELISVQ